MRVSQHLKIKLDDCMESWAVNAAIDGGKETCDPQGGQCRML